jgi:hypothetical protein
MAQSFVVIALFAAAMVVAADGEPAAVETAGAVDQQRFTMPLLAARWSCLARRPFRCALEAGRSSDGIRAVRRQYQLAILMI